MVGCRVGGGARSGRLLSSGREDGVGRQDKPKRTGRGGSPGAHAGPGRALFVPKCAWKRGPWVGAVGAPHTPLRGARASDKALCYHIRAGAGTAGRESPRLSGGDRARPTWATACTGPRPGYSSSGRGSGYKQQDAPARGAAGGRGWRQGEACQPRVSVARARCHFSRPGACLAPLAPQSAPLLRGQRLQPRALHGVRRQRGARKQCVGGGGGGCPAGVPVRYAPVQAVRGWGAGARRARTVKRRVPMGGQAISVRQGGWSQKALGMGGAHASAVDLGGGGQARARAARGGARGRCTDRGR